MHTMVAMFYDFEGSIEFEAMFSSQAQAVRHIWKKLQDSPVSTAWPAGTKFDKDGYAPGGADLVFDPRMGCLELRTETYTHGFSKGLGPVVVQRVWFTQGGLEARQEFIMAIYEATAVGNSSENPDFGFLRRCAVPNGVGFVHLQSAAGQRIEEDQNARRLR